MVYQQTDGCIELELDSNDSETIVALATARGRGSIGVIRVSGSLVKGLIEKLLASDTYNTNQKRFLEPRRVHLSLLKDHDGESLDQVLLLYFSSPNSYTGEDVLEIQAHGGMVSMQILLRRVLQLGQEISPQFRMALPGEFTKRAFLNGKLDLAQAEAVAAIIEATNESAVKSAMRSLQGEFSKDILLLQQRLNHLRVFVEATLDFPEEEIEFLEAEHVFQQIDTLRLDINSILVKARQGSLLQEGIRLALLGLPNTGKSSLLNLLSGTEKSIVTPIAGTTRDKVEDTILINDIPIQFVDTAGLRVSEDVVEKIGIERSWEEVEKADIIIFVSDLSRVHEETYREQEDTVLRDVNKRKNNNKLLHVLNKVDLFDTQQYQELISSSYPCAHTISTKSNYGIEDLKKQIAKLAGKSENQEGVYLARHRHIRAIEHAEEHLTRASEALSTKPILLDVVAEELRLMQKCLDTILGEQTADDLLGQIFSSFCIGK